jgi:hypothetical protein
MNILKITIFGLLIIAIASVAVAYVPRYVPNTKVSLGPASSQPFSQ